MTLFRGRRAAPSGSTACNREIDEGPTASSDTWRWVHDMCAVRGSTVSHAISVVAVALCFRQQWVRLSPHWSSVFTVTARMT